MRREVRREVQAGGKAAAAPGREERVLQLGARAVFRSGGGGPGAKAPPPALRPTPRRPHRPQSPVPGCAQPAGPGARSPRGACARCAPRRLAVGARSSRGAVRRGHALSLPPARPAPAPCSCPLPARRWPPPLFPGVRRTRPLGPGELPFPSPGPAPWSSGSSFPGVRVHAQPRAQHPGCVRAARACIATRRICAGDRRRAGPLPATAVLLPVTAWCFGKLVHRS